MATDFTDYIDIPMPPGLEGGFPGDDGPLLDDMRPGESFYNFQPGDIQLSDEEGLRERIALGDPGNVFNPNRISQELESVTAELNAYERSSLASQLGIEQKDAERDYQRNLRNIGESFGDRIGAVNQKISDAKRELSVGENSYRLFMDTISPGFSKAVNQAEKAAAATAAIEMTFSDASEDIDAAYASSSGRVRAIADKLAGEGNAEVAQALNDTIYEMKGFIDQQGELNRTQTLGMHDIAAKLAAAAAQSEHAGFRGEAARDTFELQGKYEKILTDLVRQRSLLNAQRQRALRNLEEGREDWKRGFNRRKAAGEEEVDFDTSLFAANRSRDQIHDTSSSILERDWEGTSLAIAAEDNENFWTHVDNMDSLGYTDWASYATYLDGLAEQRKAQSGDDSILTDTANLIGTLVRYEDQIEVAVQMRSDVDAWFDVEYVPNSANRGGAHAAQVQDLIDMGMSFGDADRLVQHRNRDVWEQ